jgi:hypothetical protein
VTNRDRTLPLIIIVPSESFVILGARFCVILGPEPRSSLSTYGDAATDGRFKPGHDVETLEMPE